MADNGAGSAPALLLPLDPPIDLWLGVNYFHEVTLRIRASDARREDEKRRGR